MTISGFSRNPMQRYMLFLYLREIIYNLTLLLTITHYIYVLLNCYIFLFLLMCHFAGLGRVLYCFGGEIAEILTDEVITIP